MGNLFSDVTCKPDMAAAALQRDDQSALAARLTPVQWLICGIACLGFAFDLYETLMTALIVRPVLSTLGNLRSGTPEFNLWVGLFFFLPGVAGGIFGLLGGYLTDLLGRRRVLVWSILLYAFSAWAAGFATSLPLLLFLRCTTWIGTCVEQVAAIAWLAELFANPKQRQSVLGYTQVAFGFGGMMVTAAYYLAVTYGEHFPAIYGAHEPWRYTLLSGLIPAIPLVLVRPFLPESPIWGEKKARGTLKRDRKSTRLNSSHGYISYAVFCLKKKNAFDDISGNNATGDRNIDSLSWSRDPVQSLKRIRRTIRIGYRDGTNPSCGRLSYDAGEL